MKVIIYDLGLQFDAMLRKKCDDLLLADGKYIPCQGCFCCWTKHPAECFIKDNLKLVCRVIGRADELTIITENLYGSYSPNIKNVLDRSIGISAPLSTYRGKQMHHTLRYGKHKLLKVIVYGDITAQEMQTFTYLVERNAINYGFENFEVFFLNNISELEGLL